MIGRLENNNVKLKRILKKTHNISFSVVGIQVKILSRSFWIVSRSENLFAVCSVLVVTVNYFEDKYVQIMIIRVFSKLILFMW